MEGFSFIRSITGLNRPNTGKEDDDDDDDDEINTSENVYRIMVPECKRRFAPFFFLVLLTPWIRVFLRS
jgi:hypothetical protein